MPIIDRYKEEIRENKPIEYSGVTLYPLRVRDFALYQNAKPAMELLLSSLTPTLARLSWFACLQQMDADAIEAGTPTNFTGSVLRLLAQALHLEAQTDPVRGGAVYPLIPLFRQETNRIASLQVGFSGGRLIDAKSMGEIRELLAAQNGYTLPNEEWNPELVKAQRYTQTQKDARFGIEYDFEALVYSVACGAHARVSEVWDWPIKEFFGIEKAVDRMVNYQVYTSAEASGMVKFKNGNPYPSWRFNRSAELPGDFKSLDELDAGAKGLLTDNTR